MDSFFDLVFLVKVDNGLIVELDGKCWDQFDMIDWFIVDYVINVECIEQVMCLEVVEIVCMLVDIYVSWEEIIVIIIVIMLVKVVEVMVQMNVVEMMMVLQKMCVCWIFFNQCYVINFKDNLVQIVVDVVEVGICGFLEQEIMVGIVCYVLFNVLVLLVGLQCGCFGVLMQCLVEEVIELELGMCGLISYVEMVLVYGMEVVFIDGDDILWLKVFFVLVYVFCGLKMCYIFGIGFEVLMGYLESKLMFYFELCCIFIIKGVGVQGL